MVTRKQKEEIVKELKKKISSSNFVAFLNFHKLSVKKSMEFRRALKKAEGDYIVSKKTLISVAAKESGLEVDKKKLEGEVGVVFGGEKEDTILAVAKEIANFAKKNSEMLKIIGGIWNKEWADINQIKRLAAIPGREALLTQLAFILSQPVSSLARVLSEVSKKGQN
ncbi:MAG: 50S ribosomal protein L10 [Patescibacteria group bacterium]